MSTLYWIGKADAVAQVVAVTPGGTIGTETFTLTVGGVEASYTAQSGDTATEVAAGLAGAWNANTHPYLAAVTAVADGGSLTLTADEAGVPFEVSAAATGSAALAASTTTASAGPNHWDTAGNWSTGQIPTAGDTVVLADGDVPVLWGLDQSTVTLAELEIRQSYTGMIGLPDDVFTAGDAATDTTKPEYRETSLKIGADVIRVGEDEGVGGSGSGRIKLDTGSVQTTLHVLTTADQSADDGLAPVRWMGSHAGNIVRIISGEVGLATSLPGQTAVVNELSVGQGGALATPAQVRVAPGVTLTTLHQSDGTVRLSAGATAIHQSGGTLLTEGSGVVGEANISGTAYLNATGDITTLRVTGTGIADFSRSAGPRTVTHCELHAGASINLDNGAPLSVTFTNDIALVRCRIGDCILTTGPHVRLGLAVV